MVEEKTKEELHACSVDQNRSLGRGLLDMNSIFAQSQKFTELKCSLQSQPYICGATGEQVRNISLVLFQPTFLSVGAYPYARSLQPS